MNKKLAVLLIIFAGTLLVGYTPRPYSDVAEYRRLPMSRRIDRLQKAGEDLFLRRNYEEAITVFENILALDESDMKAKLWIQKAKNRQLREQNEVEKQNLYKRFGGKLIPKELIYNNWHWGPEVGHFEVRYSEPKPYVPPVRKFHPRASDDELKAQKEKAGKSGSAADLFELSMRHWSRREKDEAIKAYFKAVKADSAILAEDDELLLATAVDEFQKQVEAGKAGPDELLIGGRIGMIQGDRREAIKYLVRAAEKKPGLKEDISDILKSFIESPGIEPMSIPAEIFSFRQAYVYDKDADMIYLRLVGMPRNGNLIFPIDVTFDLSGVTKIEAMSKDVLFAHALPGFDGAARLWFVLPERDVDHEYEIKLTLHVDRKLSKWVDLSNFAVSGQIDNWSFVIGSEFNFSQGLPEGEYLKNLEGVQVTGYHLSRSDGKGPYLALENFKEPLPRQIDVWQLIEADL